MKYIFLFNCEKYNEFRIDILGIGPNGGNSNGDGDVKRNV